MKTTHNLLAAAAASIIGVAALPASAQGLFAKAGEQANRALAVYESIWDSYYSKFDELLIAEAMKDEGSLEFDTEHGIAHFPIRLRVNDEAYNKWLEESRTLLSAAGIKEDERSGADDETTQNIGGTSYTFTENANSEIKKAFFSGELKAPMVIVTVELIDAAGTMLNYAAIPLGLFKENTHGPAAYNKYPLCDLGRGLDSADKSDIAKGKVDEAAYVSVSFAGLTRKTLLAVEDIRCRVLVDPEATKECRRLALAKIEADSKVFAEYGIESKTILLPGGVPLAVNKTPKGFWFCRYEVTHDQWEAVMQRERHPIDKPFFWHRTPFSESDYSLSELPDGTEIKDLEALAMSSLKLQGRDDEYGRLASPDMPVDHISWGEVQQFVKKLNSLPVVQESGLEFAIPRGLYYHPSERREPESHWNYGTPDWEYACLGGKAYGGRAMQQQGSLYGFDLEGNMMDWEETSWNPMRSGYETLHAKFGNFDSEFLHPVGMKRPNAFGLYDMIGNAGEIVQRVDNPRGDGIVKATGNNSMELVDYTSSKNFYISSDNNGNQGRGLRLFAIQKQ